MRDKEQNKFEERRKHLKEDCVIKESDLCFWLSGKVGCEDCYIRSLKSDEQREEAKGKWWETISLLPRDIDSYHETDTCVFCKDKPRKKDKYATVEMAHAEPYYEKGMIFGLGKKVRTPVGSMLSVQMSVCDHCKNVFRISSLMPLLGAVIAIIVAILVLMTDLGDKMYSLFLLLPVLFVVIMAIAGYLIGNSIHLAYLRKKAKETRVDLAEIPLIANMLSRGWFFFQTNGGMPKVFFYRSKQYDRILKPDNTLDAEENEDTISLDNMNI